MRKQLTALTLMLLFSGMTLFAKIPNIITKEMLPEDRIVWIAKDSFNGLPKQERERLNITDDAELRYTLKLMEARGVGANENCKITRLGSTPAATHSLQELVDSSQSIYLAELVDRRAGLYHGSVAMLLEVRPLRILHGNFPPTLSTKLLLYQHGRIVIADKWFCIKTTQIDDLIPNEPGSPILVFEEASELISSTIENIVLPGTYRLAFSTPGGATILPAHISEPEAELESLEALVNAIVDLSTLDD